MFLKNNLFIISNFFLIFLGIFFFNVDYKYSPDVESNIKDVKIFINSDFDFKILFERLTNNRSIESNVFITILIYTIGVLIDNLPLVFFIINFTITVLLFYLIKYDLKSNKIDKFYFHLFSYLYLLNPDLRLWQSFLLVDYFFTVLIFIHFRFLIKKKYLISTIILFFLMFIRPTSIFILPITFLFIFFNYFFEFKNKIQINFLILASIFILVLFSLLFMNIEDLSFLGSKYKFYKDFNLAGIVIHDRWSVNYDINNFLNIFLLFIIKLIFYHQFLSSDFSLVHNVYNLFYYIPYLYIFFYMIKNIYTNSNYKFNSYYLLGLYVFIIYSVCHSILLIDFDWRYRMPLYLPLILSIVYFLHECNFDTYLKRIFKDLKIL
jgi:hypothetical protein